MNKIYSDNATLVERIMAYVEHDLHEEAATLAALGDYLEECALWQLEYE